MASVSTREAASAMAALRWTPQARLDAAIKDIEKNAAALTQSQRERIEAALRGRS